MSYQKLLFLNTNNFETSTAAKSATDLHKKFRMAVSKASRSIGSEPLFFRKDIWEDRKSQIFVANIALDQSLSDYNLIAIIKTQFIHGTRGVIFSKYNKYLDDLGAILNEISLGVLAQNSLDAYNADLTDSKVNLNTVNQYQEKKIKTEEEILDLKQSNAVLKKEITNLEINLQKERKLLNQEHNPRILQTERWSAKRAQKYQLETVITEIKSKISTRISKNRDLRKEHLALLQESNPNNPLTF